ncbi:hypothetical protein DFJ74DRAFT_713113 [Hyaloraphidium curvatum]|nr:hypothetical protein DFJ74DRAFT_713113 [Hyaloraphidium curvatum]
MCHWLAFQSIEPVPLADLLLRPSNSLRQQASDAASFTPGLPPNPARNDPINPDGHGFGYYVADAAAPIVYRSPLPAWTDPGLAQHADGKASGLLLAHVRAASPGLPVLVECCHPFRFGRMLFMQNGGISGFKPGEALQAALRKEMDPDVLAWVGDLSSDTAHVFAIFLTVLRRRGGRPGEAGNSPTLLAAALREAVREIGRIQAASGLPRDQLGSSFNLCLSDGNCIVATRDRSGFGAGNGARAGELPEAPSLYFAHGTKMWFDDEAGDLRLQHDGGHATIAVVSSEPIVMGDSQGFSEWGFEVVDNDSMMIVDLYDD